MKKLLFLVSAIIIAKHVSGQNNASIWKITTDTIELFKPFFNDEFDGKSLNSDKWLDRYQWGGLDFKTRMYSAPEMVYVSNGILTLGADTTSTWYEFPDWILDSTEIRKNKVEVKNNKVQLRYLTSVAFSKQTFKYGYFECKAKAPSGQGLWPAFWLFGGEPNEEIDFMEMKGEKHNEMHVDVHCPNKCKYIKMKGLPFITQRWGGWLKFNQRLVDEWVIYSGLWEPGKVTFYVNGEVVGEYQGDFKTSMHLIANLSIAVNGGPFAPGINKKTVLPNSFQVDYIRVWKNSVDADYQKLKQQIDFGKEDIHINKPLKETKLKTKKKFMLRRKSLKNELGYVTTMMTDNQQLQVTKNGRKITKLTIEIVDTQGKVIHSEVIATQSGLINLKPFKKGKYTLKITHQNTVNSSVISL
ncbi:MAG: family 16 glycosylhydrolase [Bacteroidota bacterium]